ncbi:polysialyltransferase family glycosyltransferase [Streptacidiphilus monticola]|uniref:Polysialyltransferase family glycosyltransferase n=1 Tax=Streptacidiphilus monticola TaxID=2161674 RepID=A0ABW1FX85_9ACTN
MVQFFVASTLYGAATLGAALDAGLFGTGHRRILLVSNNATAPEVTPALDRAPGFAALRPRFDEVRSWNAETAPQHPSEWSPRNADLPLWERQLRRSWGLGDEPVELVVESLQANPAEALVRIFGDALVHVYADGVMSYGPTRKRLPELVPGRIERLLHPDLLPGLEPLLLTEHGVPRQGVPLPAFRAVLDELAALDRFGGVPQGGALLLGQYLSPLGLLSRTEEERLHADMLRAAVAAGHRHVVFKPHPSAPLPLTRALEQAAEEACVRVTVLREPVLAETAFARLRPELVVGCFSTGLFTARALFGLPVVSVGAATVLRRLTPFANSNRVPLTLAHALMGGQPPQDVRPLLRAVGHCMQPEAYPELRSETEAWLLASTEETVRTYIGTARLSALGLPGGQVLSKENAVRLLRQNPTLRRAVREARTVRRAVTRALR